MFKSDTNDLRLCPKYVLKCPWLEHKTWKDYQSVLLWYKSDHVPPPTIQWLPHSLTEVCIFFKGLTFGPSPYLMSHLISPSKHHSSLTEIPSGFMFSPASGSFHMLSCFPASTDWPILILQVISDQVSLASKTSRSPGDRARHSDMFPRTGPRSQHSLHLTLWLLLYHLSSFIPC